MKKKGRGCSLLCGCTKQQGSCDNVVERQTTTPSRLRTTAAVRRILRTDDNGETVIRVTQSSLHPSNKTAGEDTEEDGDGESKRKKKKKSSKRQNPQQQPIAQPVQESTLPQQLPHDSGAMSLTLLQNRAIRSDEWVSGGGSSTHCRQMEAKLAWELLLDPPPPFIKLVARNWTIVPGVWDAGRGDLVFEDVATGTFMVIEIQYFSSTMACYHTKSALSDDAEEGQSTATRSTVATTSVQEGSSIPNFEVSHANGANNKKQKEPQERSPLLLAKDKKRRKQQQRRQHASGHRKLAERAKRNAAVWKSKHPNNMVKAACYTNLTGLETTSHNVPLKRRVHC